MAISLNNLQNGIGYSQETQRTNNSSLNQLSSGSRINSAKDDAAGLAISTKITSQLDGFDTAIRNANDSISALQVADGALNSLNSNIQRIQELALQSGNGALNDQDRQALQQEANQLVQESNRILDQTSFNGKNLLSNNDDLDTQLDQSGETIKLEGNNLAKAFKDLDFDKIDISSAIAASDALGTLASASELVSSRTAEIGAVSNRIENSIENVASSKVSAAEARSRISDTDYAKATSELAANQIREKAQIAIQAQANGQQGNILQLLS